MTDIVKIGDATLYHGDCLEVFLSLNGIDALITDPPYSSGGMVRSDRMASTRSKYQSSDVITEHPLFSGDNRDQRSFGYWMALWLGAALRSSKPAALCALFSDWRLDLARDRPLGQDERPPLRGRLLGPS